jgi:hypothetical protein
MQHLVRNHDHSRSQRCFALRETDEQEARKKAFRLERK